MKFYKYVIAFTALVLLSCSHVRPQAESSQNWLDTFEPTGSFCLDAYFVNSAVHGCKTWTTREISESMFELRCTELPAVSSFWASSTFVFYGNSASVPPLNHRPLCSDMNGIFAVLIAE